MQLATIDWVIIITYCLFSLFVGIYFVKKASHSTDDFFLSGRSLPWWIAGTSMVATSFATDAPLAATKLIREQGLAGLWFPLSWVFADLLTLYFFARFWRRAKVTTDAEITEERYSGKSASFLRLFSGLYSALPVNCIIMGWVTLAMVKILEVSLGWPKEYVIPILVILTLLYAVLSGLWGVVVTDIMQFIIATVGAVGLAVISVMHVGGITALKEKVVALPQFGPESLDFWPQFTSVENISFFIVVMTVQWWAQKNVAGGGQLTQRMFACKDSKHSMKAVLWFCFCHYVIRPWPWMIVALVSLVLWPNLADNEAAYPQMIIEMLPYGLRGIMIASLIAAFMSTLDTHLNWGASYLVIDLYKRFIKTDGDSKHYVWASRVSMLLLTVITGIAAFNMTSIVGAWKFLATLTAGVGPIYILRWYWWRINAWSEISGLFASGIFSTLFMFIPSLSNDESYPIRLILVLLFTTVTWLSVTFFTKPVDEETLIKFYKKVRPPLIGWQRIALKAGDIIDTDQQYITKDIIAYLVATISIVAGLFSVGKFALAEPTQGALYFAVSIAGLKYLMHDMSKRPNL